MVSKVEAETERAVSRLVAALEADALRQEADTLRVIYSQRFIWDQMAMRLSTYVQSLLDRSDVSDATEGNATILINLLAPFCVSPHDRRFYQPARVLGAAIEQAGFPGWRAIIDEEIESGFTGGEVISGLRSQFSRFLGETAGIPPQLQRRIEDFIAQLP